MNALTPEQLAGVRAMAIGDVMKHGCIEAGRVCDDCRLRALIVSLVDQTTALDGALRELRLNANRLCDRELGGTYEEDCRRSIARADTVLT